MKRTATPLLLILSLLASIASAQSYEPTPAEIRLVDRVAEDYELDGERLLQHTRIEGSAGAIEAFRGEYSEWDTVIEWVRFPTDVAALKSLEQFRAAPSAVRVSVVFGEQVFSIETLDADLEGTYDFPAYEAALCIKAMINDEETWLRVETPEGAVGYVEAKDVEIDTDSVEVVAPMLAVRLQARLDGTQLTLVARGTHLDRAPLAWDRTPDAICVTAGNEAGNKVWSTALLTQSENLDKRVRSRLLAALGPNPTTAKLHGTFTAERAGDPLPGEFNTLLHRSDDGAYLSLGDTDSTGPLFAYLEAFAEEYGPGLEDMTQPLTAAEAAKAETTTPGPSQGLTGGLGK